VGAFYFFALLISEQKVHFSARPLRSLIHIRKKGEIIKEREEQAGKFERESNLGGRPESVAGATQSRKPCWGLRFPHSLKTSVGVKSEMPSNVL